MRQRQRPRLIRMRSAHSAIAELSTGHQLKNSFAFMRNSLQVGPSRRRKISNQRGTPAAGTQRGFRSLKVSDFDLGSPGLRLLDHDRGRNTSWHAGQIRDRWLSGTRRAITIREDNKIAAEPTKFGLIARFPCLALRGALGKAPSDT